MEDMGAIVGGGGFPEVSRRRTVAAVDTVSQVLGWSVAVGGVVLLLALLSIIGERDALNEMRELGETGVEVPAVLVALESLRASRCAPWP